MKERTEILEETFRKLAEEKKYSSLRDLMQTLYPADISAILSDMPEKLMPAIFRLLPKDLAAETFVEMDSEVKEALIKSFSKPDLKRTINGGPLTIEFSESVFSQDEAITKVAQLVQLFILRGGHQLQLNTVNRERLLDAQTHPENYRNLIVRVWGWSGYFVELDKCYQDHIIRRAELLLS